MGDFSKIEPKDRGCNGLTFLLKARHKSNDENENAVSHGIDRYDVLPPDTNERLQHDDKYFGQMVMKNCVTSIETTDDEGKTWTLPFRTNLDFNKHATDEGLWLSRSVAIYPLSSKSSDTARDKNATLDTRDNSALSGDVWIGFLPLIGQLPDRVRYTIESLDGSPLIKKSPGTSLQLVLSRASGQTPKRIENSLQTKDIPLKFKTWAFSGTVHFSDGGSYSDEGPIKTVVPSRPPRAISEEAKKTNEKMNEEAKKLEEQFEMDRKMMDEQFETMRKDFDEIAKGFGTVDASESDERESDEVSEALAEAEAAATATSTSTEEVPAGVVPEPVVDPEPETQTQKESSESTEEGEKISEDLSIAPSDSLDIDMPEAPAGEL